MRLIPDIENQRQILIITGLVIAIGIMISHLTGCATSKDIRLLNSKQDILNSSQLEVLENQDKIITLLKQNNAEKPAKNYNTEYRDKLLETLGDIDIKLDSLDNEGIKVNE